MREDRDPYHKIPEPLPIDVNRVTDERARTFLRAVTSGRVDRELLTEQLNSILPDTSIVAGAQYVAALGQAGEMYAFEQRTTAEGIATFYRVRYPAETLTWVVSLDRDGLINGFSLRRSPTNKIFNVWLRNVTY